MINYNEVMDSWSGARAFLIGAAVCGDWSFPNVEDENDNRHCFYIHTPDYQTIELDFDRSSVENGKLEKGILTITAFNGDVFSVEPLFTKDVK